MLTTPVTKPVLMLMLYVTIIGIVRPTPQFGKGCDGQCNQAWNKCMVVCPGGDGPDVQACFANCVSAKQSCMTSCNAQTQPQGQSGQGTSDSGLQSNTSSVNTPTTVNVTKIKHELRKLLKLIDGDNN